MARTFYSLTFRHADGSLQTSQTCATLRVARKRMKWLLSQSFVTEVSLYQGRPGECLLERKAA